MKKFLLAFLLLASPALATTPEGCERIGNSNNYRCNVDGGTYRVENANSAEAAALAVAAQLQGQQQDQDQSQGQGQSQTSDNTNQNVNGGNSVNIEGTPKHTTSIGLGLNVGVTVPLAQGYQMKNAIDAANWFMANGQPCIAYQIMAEAPRVKRLGFKYNCGDKG